MSDTNLDGTRIRLHPEWLTAYRKGDPVAPIYVEMSPAGACNHRCSFCSERAIGYKDRKLPTGRAITLLDEMRTIGVKGVMFGGEGEPCLHPDIGNLIAAAGHYGLAPALTTNAVLFGPRVQKICLDYMVWIKASINAGDPITYGRIHKCPPTHWCDAWDNMKHAAQARHGKWPELGSQMVLLPQNRDQMEDHILRARKAGVDHCVMKPMTTPLGVDPIVKAATPLPDNWRKLRDQYSCATFRVDIREAAWGALATGRKYDRCLAVPYAWAYVDAAGNLWACSCHMLDARFNLGNILETPFQDVWFGRKRAELHAIMRDLEVKTQCRGACRMDRVNEELHRPPSPKDGHI